MEHKINTQLITDIQLTPSSCEKCDGTKIVLDRVWCEIAYMWEEVDCPMCCTKDYVPC